LRNESGGGDKEEKSHWILRGEPLRMTVGGRCIKKLLAVSEEHEFIRFLY